MRITKICRIEPAKYGRSRQQNPENKKQNKKKQDSFDAVLIDKIGGTVSWQV